MGIVQKIKNLASTGTLELMTDYYNDDNQIEYIWYRVIYKDVDGTVIDDNGPTLEGVIEVIYSTLQKLIEKENVGGLWNS